MKMLIFTILFSFTSLFLNPFSALPATINFSVVDEDGSSLPNVDIKIIRGGTTIGNLLTDKQGKVSADLDLGVYTFQVSFLGYKTETLRDFVINKNTTLSIVMKETSKLEEIFTLTSRDSKKRTASTIHESSDDLSASPAMSYAERMPSARSRRSDIPSSGQVTAGEWNDLHNWKEWVALLDKEAYLHMEAYWGISTHSRYSVTVINENNSPYLGAAVTLVDQAGNALWSGISDVSGRVELWDLPFGERTAAVKIEVIAEGKKYVTRDLKSVNEGGNIVKVKADCAKEIITDIAFIVDATSSMSDEIRFLQSELLDVIKRVSDDRNNINWSSLFYRDKTDDYLTKEIDFTKDAEKVLSFIQEQGAAGGGDYPEAVTEALEVGVSALSWRESAHVKLMFLLLDAPPHENPESLNKYRNQVAIAAQKGIKIIPITASGINRNTEFLMKFTALLTNGTYVFITDDSGIGGSHLDPVVKDFEVEKLNDLLVRLILSYTELPECQVSVPRSNDFSVNAFPNPAADFLKIDGIQKGDKVMIIATSGMTVKYVKGENSETISIDVSDLTPGNYILTVLRSGIRSSRPILIIR